MSVDHKEFFKRYGWNTLEHLGYHGGEIAVEDLYQAIKARLMEELVAEKSLGTVGDSYEVEEYDLVDRRSV